MKTWANVLYALGFQLGWFVCIVTTDLLSILYSIAFSGTYLVLALRSGHSLKYEVLWITCVISLGFLIETIAFSAGFLYSATPRLIGFISLPPLWLLSLWILFAVALRTCLGFLFNNPKLTYFASSIAIPLNYYAGAALNTDVAVNTPYALSLGAISALWIAVLWILVNLKRFYFEDRFNAR